jgi:hypothetical protein
MSVCIFGGFVGCRTPLLKWFTSIFCGDGITTLPFTVSIILLKSRAINEVLMLSAVNFRIRSSLGQFRRMSKLGVVHEALINHDFIDAAATRLVKDKKTKLGDVTAFLDTYKSSMNSSNLIHFLNGVGRRKYLRPYHIFVVASRLRAEYSDGLALCQVDRIVDSLKYYPANVGSVRILLAVVTESLVLMDDNLDSCRVGNYLLCLRDMKSGHIEVRDLIEVMSKKINGMKEGLFREDASKALEGMQLLSSKHPEVLHLVSAVSAKIALAKDGTFNGEQLGRLLLGFQRLDLDNPQVNDLLSVCLEKVDVGDCEIRSLDTMRNVMRVVGSLSGKGGSCGSRLADVLSALISKYDQPIPDEYLRMSIENLTDVIAKGNSDQSLAALLAECQSRS